ncbi:hypothetical protein NSP_34380 [Nodularia spumigena CCY9414]|nr:hypothetical protein NSP_27880 [Nodularia spumigena CCY9414]AHJ29762.1 hypothetical protein NSP_34380 [Nodularia spumigena CCY9414]
MGYTHPTGWLYFENLYIFYLFNKIILPYQSNNNILKSNCQPPNTLFLPGNREKN